MHLHTTLVLHSKSRFQISFTEKQGPAVQIHHTGNHHWVTSILTHTNELFLLDSMYDKLTTFLEIQLFQVYSNSKKRLLVKIPEVQKQINKIDCGLYAIANAVEFSFTSFSGSLHIEFNQQLMQDHLISCLEKGQFSVFPMLKVSKKGMVKCKSSVVESNCECGKADSIENMVGCLHNNYI